MRAVLLSAAFVVGLTTVSQMAVITGLDPQTIPSAANAPNGENVVRSVARRVPNNANRSVTVLFDMDALDRVNLETDVDLFLEIFTNGVWRFDAAVHYLGGNWTNKDGTPQIAGPGFRIASVEFNGDGTIARDLRGMDVRVGIRNNSLTIPFTSGILIETK